jgi:hypothetical protein
MLQVPPPDGKYSATLRQCDHVNAIAYTIHPTRNPPGPFKILNLPELGHYLTLALQHLDHAKNLNFPETSPPIFLLISAYHDLLISVINYFRKFFPMPEQH